MADAEPWKNWIENVLQTTGFTARSVGALVGLDPSVMSRIRHGGRELRLSEAWEISVLTGVPLPGAEAKQEPAHQPTSDFEVMRETEVLFSKLDSDARRFILDRLTKLDVVRRNAST